MYELKITQLDYEELSNQIDGGDLVRFHLDATGELHNPHNIGMTGELEDDQGKGRSNSNRSNG